MTSAILRAVAAVSILVTVASTLRAAAPPFPIDPGLPSGRIAALTGQTCCRDINLAGFCEPRYLCTQLEGQPACRGLNRMLPQTKPFDASVRAATTVNASTLHCGGAFDVAREPIVIGTAAIADGRYRSVQAADQHANWFFMAGSQFTGNVAQRCLVVGPAWRGRLPAEFHSTGIVRIDDAA